MSLKPRKVNFSQVWDEVRKTVEGVITLKPLTRESWNDRFSDVYQLCVSHPEPYTEKLYCELKALLDSHVKGLLEAVVSRGTENLLTNYYNEWTVYSKGACYLNNLCSYLNQQHVRRSKLSEPANFYGSYASDYIDEYEIGELALEIWKDNMIKPLDANLTTAILDCIEKHRLGVLDNNLIEIVKGTTESFVTVHQHKRRFHYELYQKMVEKPVLDASNEYFKHLAAEWLQSCTVSMYMQKVLGLFSDESQRCKLFLHRSSYPAMKRCCEKAMVIDHLDLLYAECSAMIKEERKSDMSNMYRILRGNPDGIMKFSNELKNYIIKGGISNLSTLSEDNMHLELVEMMLSLYTKYRDLIKGVFCNDANFISCLDKACSEIANYKPDAKASSRTPELLAKFCDHYLRKTTRGLTDPEVEDKLNQAITVFKYVDDKDVFQKFYARMLCKRLIYQYSHSMDAEESMINRLKQSCGYEFTNKLHRMFTDINISDDLNNKFVEEYLRKDNIDLGFNFSIFVLQAGAWPLCMTCQLVSLPEQLAQATNHFELHYNEKFNGRKLTWLHNISQGELKVSLNNKSYIVTLQTYQMAILLLFENQESMCFGDIKISYPLEKDYLMKIMNTLLESKFLLASSKDLRDDTIVSFNSGYRNKRTKIRIPSANIKDNNQETSHTVHCIEEDRKLFLQATIVRLMKSRKLMKHVQLVNEVMELCSSFTPTIHIIKKCIETLIEKQYIERTNTSDEYSYVA